ncbi:ubiquinol-cytochrome c reductase iron-sulfur subunit [Cytobacillus sp. IB215665]|uniref:QcrA and Rieske domain-containing protein n=1 Tax=Cytobacillus sp. IB215665 TaxID=3097357 RepID=UPI002A17769C|nr:Rieske 2Fe-2S domain-containing protein [Cytobacillus sp. IB215665]MDX8366709.1 Rieske 2Fe-2S domain-containing protein [Cytobacillus sp. IB215665]
MMEKWSRRTFLKNGTKGTLGMLTLAVVPISLTACNNEETIDTSSLAKLGLLEDIKKGPFPKKINYSTTIQDAWVEQKREGFVYVNVDPEDANNLLIMSPVCTHLGCIAGEVSDDEKSESNKELTFYCPCHGGEYDEFGINTGGPPPRPLDIFQPIIKNNEVYIPVLSSTERT